MTEDEIAGPRPRYKAQVELPPPDAVAMVLAPPSATTAELAANGYNKFDYFTRADWDALAKPKAVEPPAAKVVDIATRRAIED